MIPSPRLNVVRKSTTIILMYSFVARGEETIWYTPLTADCVETENKAEKEDVIFYADPQEKNCAVLNSGDFAIFFPWELHRPNCSVEKIASNVQKIVVKVKA